MGTTKEKLFLGVVLMGAFTFAHGDLEYTFYGYSLVAMNMSLFVFIQLYEKFQIAHSSQTPCGISCVQHIISVFISKENLFASIHAAPNPQVTVFCLILTGFAGCALSICYMTLNKFASATEISLGGNFNKLVSILVGFLVFSNPMTIQQIIGLAASMGGTFMFSQTQRKKKKGKNKKN